MTARAVAVVSTLCAAHVIFGTHEASAQLSNVALDVHGDCPGIEQVSAQLAPLLKDNQAQDSVTASVVDDGDSYRISLGEATRIVVDPERQCLERARVAAVFLALNLPKSKPPAEPAPPPPPPPPPRVAPPPIAAAKPHRALALRAIGGLTFAPGAQASAANVGGGVTAELGHWSVSLLGAMSTPSAPYQAQGAPRRFELIRAPFALLFGGSQAYGPLAWGAELGFALDLLRFSGESVPHPHSEIRVNPGGRLDVLFRFRASRRLEAELVPSFSFFPRTYLVRVEPATQLAETPTWWLGVSLGLKYWVWTN